MTNCSLGRVEVLAVVAMSADGAFETTFWFRSNAATWQRHRRGLAARGAQVLVGGDHERGAIFDAEALENSLHVFVHGAWTRAEDERGLGVAFALRDPVDDLGLAYGEAERDERRRSWRSKFFFEDEHHGVVATGFGETADEQRAFADGETYAGGEGFGSAIRKIFCQQIMRESGGENNGAGAIQHHDGAIKRGGELFLGVEADRDFGFEFEIFAFEQPACGAEFELHAHAGDELGNVDRFRDVVDGTGGEGADFLFSGVDGGEENHGDLAPLGVGAERGAKRKTIFAGHHHVEEDEVGAGAGEDFPGHRSAFGKEDAHAFAAERIAHDAEGGGSIIDDEERGRRQHGA